MSQNAYDVGVLVLNVPKPNYGGGGGGGRSVGRSIGRQLEEFFGGEADEHEANVENGAPNVVAGAQVGRRASMRTRAVDSDARFRSLACELSTTMHRGRRTCVCGARGVPPPLTPPPPPP